LVEFNTTIGLAEASQYAMDTGGALEGCKPPAAGLPKLVPVNTSTLPPAGLNSTAGQEPEVGPRALGEVAKAVLGATWGAREERTPAGAATITLVTTGGSTSLTTDTVTVVTLS
jgi:hypothetical protein